jgi:T5orf172 domain
MPPATCEFCNTTVQNSKTLTRHQHSKKCLEIQHKLGLNPNPLLFKCNCGFSSAIRGELKAHSSKCKNNGESNAVGKNEIPTENEDRLFDNIESKIAELLNPEIMEKGISFMISHIIHLFKNKNGHWIIKIADASRNKFILLENGDEISDNKGERITRFIRHQFIKITITELTEVYKSTNQNRIIKLEELAADLQHEDRCYHRIIQSLIRFLPNHSQTTHKTDMESSLNDLKNLLAQNKNVNLLTLNGFIYVIREREFVNADRNVFKIGRTNRPIGERLYEYPKGSYPHYFENVKDCEEAEQSIMKKLISIPDEFIHRNDIGLEYFEGDISRLISIIKSITSVGAEHT